MTEFDKIMQQIEAEAAAQTGTELGTVEHEKDLEEMTAKELTAMAENMGLQPGKGLKKEKLMEMIKAAQEAAAAPIEEGELELQIPETSAVEEVPAEPGQGILEKAASGRALVTYVGMVNLRNEALQVVRQVLHGQVLKVVGIREDEKGRWYRVECPGGREYLISAETVKYIK